MILYLYGSLILFYFLNLFYPAESLTYIVGVLAILSLAFSFPGASRFFKKVGAGFLLIGCYIYSTLDEPLSQLPTYMTSMVVLLSLFYVLPFINSMIVVGRYDRNVNKLLKLKMSHLGQLYYRGSLVSFLIGTFLNIATIPLVETVLQKNLKEKAEALRSAFISKAMLRGYALCLVWSPMEILVAVTVDITGVNYVHLLPWMLLFSVILLGCDWIFGWRYRTYKLTAAAFEEERITFSIIKKIIELLLYLAVFIIVIVTVRTQFSLGFLQAVSLVIIPYSFLWALFTKRIRTYVSYSIRIWKERTFGLSNYMVLFLSVGFFISVLTETTFIDDLQRPFAGLAQTPILLFIAIQVLFLGLAMIGFHPLVTITILGEVLQPVLSLINPLSIGIVLITSGLSTVMAGPYNITVSLTGNLLNLNPYQVSMNNIGFAFLFSGVGTLLAVFLL